MSVAAFGLFPGVMTRAGGGHGVGPTHGLGVDDRGGGYPMATGASPYLIARCVVTPLPHTGFSPAAEDVVHRHRGRENAAHLTPSDHTPGQIEDRIQDETPQILLGSAALVSDTARRRQQPPDQRPLDVGHRRGQGDTDTTMA